MAYDVKLNMFEGPLDLLLHLIEKAEVDVNDIPVSLITEQYMNYIYVMQELQLDIASEFLVMAASLLEIKSKMLLPRKESFEYQPSLELMDEEEDPRQELARRLLEYKKFKTVAELLRSFETDQSKVFTRPPEDLSRYVPVEEENPVADVTLYDLMEALSLAFKKAVKDQTPVARMQRDEISVKERIREIKNLLTVNERIHFSQLFGEQVTRVEIVTTFMAILEMMRKHQLVCHQSDLFGDIILSNGGGGANG
jgi:segregation and condensation protein A